MGLLTKPKYLTTMDVGITKVIKLHPRGMRVYTDIATILPMLVDILQSDWQIGTLLCDTRGQKFNTFTFFSVVYCINKKLFLYVTNHVTLAFD